MNQEIRNKLRNVVTQCRELLEESISQDLEGKYGIFARKDVVTADANAKMAHLSEEEQAARKDILDHFGHIKARGFKPKEALDQLVREIAFTHLNRLCAYKMMEAREVYIGDQKFREAVSRGFNSNGVKFYLADHPEEERLFSTGHQGIAYRHFLDWLGGCLSDEIGILFNPNDPANRLYPRQKTLDAVLDLLNSGGIKPEETELRVEWPKIWLQDETIGWVYQYFTPKELRDQARKDSPTPRNSYELAFRNQFFTPRYVVEFLTDNTLGRIWYEMRKGDTKLTGQCRYMVRRPTEIFLKEGEQSPNDTNEGRDELSQEELLKLPVHILHRAKKDPRELRILDPASGSGHFLLYCFDLLLTIYEEAYADAELGPALQKDYANLDDLRRDVPRLILAHNVHGIDIDLRASQIAALALWLRCQRAYQEMGLKRDRTKITRSNFACAEPMPGEDQMLKEFVGQLEPKFLGQVVEVVFEKMKLAGEAGSLLRIEEEIRDAVAVAKKQWVQETTRAIGRKGEPLLFTQAELNRIAGKPGQPSLFDLSDITNERFFEQAEAKVIDALREYAETAHNGQQLRRHLFAEDAVRGFAFVDLCQKRYDVVLMNPPFGDPTPAVKSSKTIVPSDQPDDLYCWFVGRAKGLLHTNGLIGCITSSSFKTYTQYEAFRTSFIATPALMSFCDLGWEVLDEAYVEAACYVLSPSHHSRLPTPFFDVRKLGDKSSALLELVGDLGKVSLRVPSDFHILESSPIIHEWSRSVLLSLSKYKTFGSFCREIGIGAGPHTFFYRLRWEVEPSEIGLKKRWAPFANGGSFSPFRREDRLLLEWENAGKRIKSYLCEKYPYLNGNTDWKIQLEQYYGTPGLTFGKKTTNFSAQVLPTGFIFSFEGIGVFPATGSDPFVLLAYLNSSFASWFLNVSCGLHKNPVYVSRLPVPSFSPADQQVLRECAKEGWKLQASRAVVDETTSLFVMPQALYSNKESVRLERLLDQIDEVVWKYIKIPPVNRSLPIVEADDEEDTTADLIPESMMDGSQTISYSLGTIFGRWDIRFAIGKLTVPPLPDPFAPLPTCAPGMLVGNDRLPASEPPKDYPFEVAWDGVVPDDPTSPHDILVRVRAVLERIWTKDAEKIEADVCHCLGIKGLREYFRKATKGGFWDEHVSQYTANRRKAPIYWLLQSSKRNYCLWLYYHRLDKGLLFKALVNYVEPKIRLESSRLDTLRSQQATPGSSGKEAKRLAKEVEHQEDFLSELRDFDDKLRKAATLHLRPDLNDGVLLNIAPLHELVPWKPARSCWEELLAGKYEWSSIGTQLRQKGLVK
ncbi:MAG: BREX-1 system adenine-specific DNA-methyltransferase PglX [Candidatus Acidiferrales bacterium]